MLGLPCTPVVHGGGSRIRTHVPFRRSGFQDRRLKPLGHPSAIPINLLTKLYTPPTSFRLRRRNRMCSLTPPPPPLAGSPNPCPTFRESRFRRDALNHSAIPF